ncbi:MAG TPA: sugar transferase, partial [Gemmatimonadales bacterium]|nr:sugar transferase [Gemmatimonadales bacterium]
MTHGTETRPARVSARDRWLRLVEDTSPSIEPRARSEAASRVMNFTLALIAIVLVSPIMVLIALAVKLTSRGPILYYQTRVGLDRRRGRPASPHQRRTHDLG